MTGPLTGIRVVELAGIGPGPYAAMLLGDLGAEVVLVERPTLDPIAEMGRVLSRGRRSLAVDLKADEGREIVLRLVATADVLIEGFRPGVTERLGLGPTDCHERNPRLVYARMTGWGQDGPLASTAGHDIDYAAVAGALHPVGYADRPPTPPINYVADFGGGSTFLVIGVLAALLERESSGRGQVVDAAMVDGAASLTTMLHGMMAAGGWSTSRASNLLDGAAPFYDTYRCADGEFVAVGALEPRFFAELCRGLDLDPAEVPQLDVARWPAQKQQMAEVFATRTREEWVEVFDGTDACVSAVLSLAEAPDHPHNLARSTFVDVGGVVQPAPAPRFSRSSPGVPRPAPTPGADTDDILRELGVDPGPLRASGVVA